MEGPNRSIDKYLRQTACIACMLLIVAVTTPITVLAVTWHGGGAGYWPAGGWTPMGMTYSSMPVMTNYWGMTAPVSDYTGGWARQGSGYWGAISPAWGTGTGFSTYQSTGASYYGFTGQYGTGPQAQWTNASIFPQQQTWSSYAGYPAGGWRQPIVAIPSNWLNMNSYQSCG